VEQLFEKRSIQFRGYEFVAEAGITRRVINGGLLDLARGYECVYIDLAQVKFQHIDEATFEKFSSFRYILQYPSKNIVHSK
jgi:hypothetical protein